MFESILGTALPIHKIIKLEEIMEKIIVNYEGRPCYPIYIEDSYSNLNEALSELNIKSRKVCIVTDSTVESLYLDTVINEIAKEAKKVISYTFPAGEKSKNLDVIAKIYEVLIEEKFDRKDLLIALGGGVVGDMTGFAAATYLRGISFVQLPTTLLSMVDSSIGGKTGVDFKAYKNMVGAFHQPSAVYINLAVLETLTDSQFRSGMGEVIKHAMIKDQEYYFWLKNNRNSIMDLQMNYLKDMIDKSLHIKKDVVERDPKEKGERALLNFGHTLGHAIEKHMNFTMLHGDCVSVGICAATYISYKRGYISKEILEDVKACLASFTLPIQVPQLEVNEVILTTQSDKKMEAGQIKFVLLNQIGNAYIDMSVTNEELKEALKFVMQ